MRILDCVGSKDDGEHIAELFPEFRAAGRVRHVDALALAPVATIGLLIVAAPVWAGSIAGGSVTGGSALTAGGKFIDLTVPWGAASVPANTVGPANFMSPNLYAFDEAQNFTLTANLAIQVGLNPISAGTEVNSSFVTFRPSTATENLLGYVEFNGVPRHSARE